VVCGFLFVALTAVLTLRATNNFTYSSARSTPTPGLTILAVLFVGALAIERLLEPIAPYLQQLLERRATRKASSTATAPKSAQANMAILLWAIASSVGIVAAAVMKVYLLKAVGIASPGRVLDVIATGLVLGAGTKPLHDLVTLVSPNKGQAS
jgi:FtsH-binding integral membrane protein